MRSNISVLAILLLSLGTGSCTKVIHVNLNDAAPVYVIEGVMTDQPGTCEVLLSQTKNFGADNSFAGVSGARVSITESGGDTTSLTETSPGVYKDMALYGSSGKSYTLSVNIGGQSFTASCTMPSPVPFDSLFVENADLFGKKRKFAYLRYKDPEEAGNCYRFIQFVNGVKEKAIFVQNDQLTNGNTITSELRYPQDDNKDNDIHSGDAVTIEMLSIDPVIYKYWYSLDRSATGSSQSATPANPVTNMTGGALGYFSVHTLQTKTVVAP